MDLSIAGFALALFFILPGYLAMNLELWVSKGKAASGIGDWIATSILRSLVLNGIAFPLWLIYANAVQVVPWSENVDAAWQVASALSLSHVASYVASLYGLALLQGLLIGAVVKRWKELSWALRWKSVSPYEDVWNDILSDNFRSKENLARRGTPTLRRPWLKLVLDDGRVAVGQMVRSSVTIEQDKPIEVFLAPAYVIDREHRTVEALGGLAGCESLGLYLRVCPETAVEIVSAQEDWRPQFAVPPLLTRDTGRPTESETR